MTRVKPLPVSVPLKNLGEADIALAKIAALRRGVACEEAALNEQIDRLKAQAALACEPARQEIGELEQALIRFADYHKGDLFTPRRSLQLTFGIMGYRASSKAKPLPKWTWERVLVALQERGMTTCIRTKHEPDKEALKCLLPERLAAVGVRVVSEDVFFYELDEQALGTSAGIGEAV